MVIVMNVVNVAEDRAEEFERAFLSRERLLNQADGFAGFELLRRDGHGEYVVLTRWESRDAFKAWVNSDLFRRAHSRREGGIAMGNELRTYDVLDAEVPA